jgi:hypothetical protein
MPKFMRGARPSPRHKLAGARPHIAQTPTPPQWLWLPSKLSFWGNETNGDCVSCEEAFAKACHQPEIFIPDDEVVSWASANGFLNGAMLTDVMDMMQTKGFALGSMTYDDGPYNSVDWTNPAILENAISQAPVKIGIAADQVEKTYGDFCPDSPQNGWFGTGYVKDQNEDHCVSLAGYGPISWLKNQLGTGDPSDSNEQGYAMFTWSSIGVLDVPSLLAICGEAWLRSPGTIVR